MISPPKTKSAVRPSSRHEEQQEQQREEEQQPSTLFAPAKPQQQQQLPNPNKEAEEEKTSFEEFYLRQATREFANDLDKLRSAGDFHAAKSVPLLIAALKQGTKVFSLEERRKVVSS